jgi:Holliday junction resolvasome RuvABC endonuclease subunit
MISLGLDVSTKTIGLCCIETRDNKIISFHTEHFSLPKTDNKLSKLISAKEYITNAIDKFKPDSVCIEDFSLYMQKSNAKTIVALAVMNSTLQLTVLEKTGKEAVMLNVNSIRAKLKLKDRLKKDDMPEAVAKRVGISWDWILDKKGNASEINFDRADACASALSYLIGEKLI